jgi:hypothetical protein
MLQVDLEATGSQLIDTICSKYEYNPESIFLTLEVEPPSEGLVLSSNMLTNLVLAMYKLREQGVTAESTIKIQKKNRKELRKQRTSITSIKKKVGNSTEGVTLTVISDFTPTRADQLALKKGESVTGA